MSKETFTESELPVVTKTGQPRSNDSISLVTLKPSYTGKTSGACQLKIGLGTRNLPEQPDVTALYATDRTETVALLLELHEPLEWERVTLAIESAPGTLSRLVNSDGTRALPMQRPVPASLNGVRGTIHSTLLSVVPAETFPICRKEGPHRTNLQACRLPCPDLTPTATA